MFGIPTEVITGVATLVGTILFNRLGWKLPGQPDVPKEPSKDCLKGLLLEILQETLSPKPDPLKQHLADLLSRESSVKS